MSIKSFLSRDLKRTEKINKLQLPNKFKTIGWTLFIISFVSIFIINIVISDEIIRKQLMITTKYGILLGLLIVSLSKEKIEDEYIKSIRMQSYMFAFIIGVIQSLIFPFIDFGVDSLLNGEANFEPAGDFFILWVLLLCQIMFFNILKWKANE